MLIRGGRNRKIATLKRSPTEKELEGFDLSMYPKTFDALQESKWKQMNDASLRNQPKFDSTPSKSQQSKGTSFEEMVQELGGQGQQILGNLYQVSLTSSYCWEYSLLLDMCFTLYVSCM